MSDLPGIEYLWKDRKRILGMPISFTKYAISEDRLFCEKGLLKTSAEEILLYRIKDISLEMTLGQKLFGVGSIFLNTADSTSAKFEIKNVKKPREVKELLHQKVEAAKLARRFRVGELLDEGDEFDIDDSDN